MQKCGSNYCCALVTHGNCDSSCTAAGLWRDVRKLDMEIYLVEHFP